VRIMTLRRIEDRWSKRQLAFPSQRRHHFPMKDLITMDPAICNGRPVVKGTRITVKTVMEFLAAGDSVDDVLEEYPALTREDVLACMDWAARLMANDFQIAALA
jgi:uncharacterized protein (DUF433 family)